MGFRCEQNGYLSQWWLRWDYLHSACPLQRAQARPRHQARAMINWRQLTRATSQPSDGAAAGVAAAGACAALAGAMAAGAGAAVAGMAAMAAGACPSSARASTALVRRLLDRQPRSTAPNTMTTTEQAPSPMRACTSYLMVRHAAFIAVTSSTPGDAPGACVRQASINSHSPSRCRRKRSHFGRGNSLIEMSA